MAPASQTWIDSNDQHASIQSVRYSEEIGRDHHEEIKRGVETTVNQYPGSVTLGTTPVIYVDHIGGMLPEQGETGSAEVLKWLTRTVQHAVGVGYYRLPGATAVSDIPDAIRPVSMLRPYTISSSLDGESRISDGSTQDYP
jgi:hypothetical protein